MLGEFYKVRICLLNMGTLYVIVGLIGAFIFGFLVGFFLGLGKFKKRKSEYKQK